MKILNSVLRPAGMEVFCNPPSSIQVTGIGGDKTSFEDGLHYQDLWDIVIVPESNIPRRFESLANLLNENG